MIISLIAGIIIMIIGYIRYDFRTILYGLFFVACYISYKVSEQKKKERERAEEEQKEELAKLSDKFQERIDSSEEQIKKLKEDLLLKDIILTLDCSPDDAPHYLSLIHDTGLTYEFEDASYAGKVEVIDNAKRIAAFYKDELTPSMQRIHCPISFIDYVQYKSCFSDDIYSDIPLDKKVRMVYHKINNDSEIPSNKNEQVLRSMIKKDNPDFYDKILNSPYDKMSRDDILYLFNLFNREFAFVGVSEDDFDRLMGFLPDTRLSFSDYDISLTFRYCLFNFAVFYYDPFTYEIADYIYDCNDSLLQYVFDDFSYKLFFSAVFFDIAECKSTILKKIDFFIEMLEARHTS